MQNASIINNVPTQSRRLLILSYTGQGTNTLIFKPKAGDTTVGNERK